MIPRVTTTEGVKAIGACQSLLPDEAAVLGSKRLRKHHRRIYRPNGEYEWRCKIKTNDNGKVTPEAHEMGDLLLPFQRADTERHSSLEMTRPQAKLRDQDGGVRMLDPALAEATARQNGWSHAWRAGGSQVEGGIGGMLWRRVRSGWEPLGRRCLGRPLRGSAHVARRGLQHDPDGAPWRFVAGKWRKL